MQELESWLRSKNMTTVNFATLAKCSRQVIWKVKRKIPIDPKIAARIINITDSEVIPIMNPAGRPRCEQIHIG